MSALLVTGARLHKTVNAFKTAVSVNVVREKSLHVETIQKVDRSRSVYVLLVAVNQQL